VLNDLIIVEGLMIFVHGEPNPAEQRVIDFRRLIGGRGEHPPPSRLLKGQAGSPSMSQRPLDTLGEQVIRKTWFFGEKLEGEKKTERPFWEGPGGI